MTDTAVVPDMPNFADDALIVALPAFIPLFTTMIARPLYVVTLAEVLGSMSFKFAEAAARSEA